MDLPGYVETLAVLGDESRIRLCALLRDRELCVTDLVHVTGMSQSRVSTHLARLRDAGFVRDRRRGAQSFYGLATDTLTAVAQVLLDQAMKSVDPTLEGDRSRLSQLDAERREGLPQSFTDEMERHHSPGRTWQSLAAGIAALLRLGDVLDVGSGDGAAAMAFAPYCASLTCIDTSPRMLELARERLARHPHVRTQMADVHALPFPTGSFDVVLVFHTLTYAERPGDALRECARVLRPGGRLVSLCLDRHEQLELTGRYGERHPGFSPHEIRALLKDAGLDVGICEAACREARKPHLQVVLATADKPKPSSHRRSGRAVRKSPAPPRKKARTD